MDALIATEKNTEHGRSSRGGVARKGFISAILLATVVAHSLMSSSRLLGFNGGPSHYGRKHSIELEETEDAALSSSAYLRSTAVITGTAQKDDPLKFQRSERFGKSRLPHWMVAVECSAYSLDCFTRVQRESRYLPYPFPFSNDVMDDKHSDWNMTTLDNIPDEWLQNLESRPITNYSDSTTAIPTIQDRHNLYPPVVSEVDYRSCLDFAGISDTDNNLTRTTIQQLDEILSSDRFNPEPNTNMIAFTISDYSYAQDMLHDMFQMMDHVVGFSHRHFFMVAIDVSTVKMACQFGYPVIFWKESDTESLKDAVANTKLVLSLELVSRGVDFFFTEMDVWWIKSPMKSLIDFQQSDNRPQQNHLLFSGHQNNPFAPNIGVYAAKANNYSIEYFQTCLEVLKHRPETHDQWAMAEVHRLFEHTLRNQTYQLGGDWGPQGPPPTPRVQLPFEGKYWSPHEIVADERPMPTGETMAIHTLCDTPLLNPHGKKMIAKELGAYYGFQTNARPYIINEESISKRPPASDVAGYYTRSSTSHRRYLVLDGPIRTNFYSMVIQDQYHDRVQFQWIISLLFAIAKLTDRILILPQVFNADMDAGTYFTWNIVDYSKLNAFVDTREGNFLSNPKSWAFNTSLPFPSVATIAMMAESKGDAILYEHVFHETGDSFKQSWHLKASDDKNVLDAFVAFLLSVNGIDATELLLINPDLFSKHGFMHTMAYRLSQLEKTNQYDSDLPFRVGRMEREVGEVYKLLGWCWDEAMRHSVSKTSASHSCYGKGQR